MSAPNNKASLGCGTLILIALIVMIFSNSNRHGVGRLEHEIGELRSEIQNLKAEVANQSTTLAKIKQSLDEIKRPVKPTPTASRDASQSASDSRTREPIANS